MFVACSSSDDTDHAAEIAKLEQWIVGQWSGKDNKPSMFEVYIFNKDKTYYACAKYDDDENLHFINGGSYSIKRKKNEYVLETVNSANGERMVSSIEFEMRQPEILYIDDQKHTYPLKRDSTNYPHKW